MTDTCPDCGRLKLTAVSPTIGRCFKSWIGRPHDGDCDGLTIANLRARVAELEGQRNEYGPLLPELPAQPSQNSSNNGCNPKR